MRHRNFTFRFYILFIILAFLLTGCKPATPTSIPTAAPALPAPVETSSQVLPGLPSPATAAPAGVETKAPLAGVVLASPSAIPCALPDGWSIYTIQSGDTLSDLARLTGSTVEELIQANCLEDDKIIAYEELFLPRRPPSRVAAQLPPAAPPAGGEEPSTTTVDCNASLTCVLEGAKLPIISGGPGNPSSYTPCKEGGQGFWIDIHGGSSVPIPQGDRTFLYACGTTTTSGGLVAQAIPINEGEPIPLITYTFHPALNRDKGQALAVIDFPAPPDMPIGPYRVQVSVGNQSADSVAIEVVPPDANHSYILPIPLVGSPGDTFRVYYVNYPLNTSLTAVLHSADPPGVREDYAEGLFPRLRWPVTITNILTVVGTPATGLAGWAMVPFTFPTTAIPNAYNIADEQLEAASMLWIK